MITIEWSTYVIEVPQSYLTLLSGTLYELDTNQFHLDLRGIEATDLGMPHPETHTHTTEISVAGVTYARFVEILAPYSVEFEDTGAAYSVILTGSNNNIFDLNNGILVPTPLVTVIAQNSAGLINPGIDTIQPQLDVIEDQAKLAATRAIP